MARAEVSIAESQLSLTRPESGALVLRLSGDWRIGHDLPRSLQCDHRIGPDVIDHDDLCGFAAKQRKREDHA